MRTGLARWIGLSMPWSKVLEPGKDCIVEVPADRWEVDDFYDADRGAPGKMVTRFGGFLEQPAAALRDAARSVAKVLDLAAGWQLIGAGLARLEA